MARREHTRRRWRCTGCSTSCAGATPTSRSRAARRAAARIDHEILRRTERVWTSDCNDALERQTIQRRASMFIPPEVMGAHIGPPRSHTTGRVHTLAFRAATALFGHLGIEWNLLDARRRRARRPRRLGRAVQAPPCPAAPRRRRPCRPRRPARPRPRRGRRRPPAGPGRLRAADHIAGAAAAAAPHPRARPRRRTWSSLVEQPGARPGELADAGPVAVQNGIELTGRQLAAHGVRLPVVAPESVALLWIEAL